MNIGELRKYIPITGTTLGVKSMSWQRVGMESSAINVSYWLFMYLSEHYVDSSSRRGDDNKECNQ